MVPGLIPLFSEIDMITARKVRNIYLSWRFAASRSKVRFFVWRVKERDSCNFDSVLKRLNFLESLPSVMWVISLTTMNLLLLVVEAPGSFQHSLFPFSWRNMCLCFGGPRAPYFRNVVPKLNALKAFLNSWFYTCLILILFCYSSERTLSSFSCSAYCLLLTLWFTFYLIPSISLSRSSVLPIIFFLSP